MSSWFETHSKIHSIVRSEMTTNIIVLTCFPRWFRAPVSFVHRATSVFNGLRNSNVSISGYVESVTVCYMTHLLSRYNINDFHTIPGKMSNHKPPLAVGLLQRRYGVQWISLSEHGTLVYLLTRKFLSHDSFESLAAWKRTKSKFLHVLSGSQRLSWTAGNMAGL